MVLNLCAQLICDWTIVTNLSSTLDCDMTVWRYSGHGIAFVIVTFLGPGIKTTQLKLKLIFIKFTAHLADYH